MINRQLAQLCIGLVHAYQWTLSPLVAGLFGTSCRFTPSCSTYAVEAFREHGAARGLVLALRRIGRCQPFARAGYDPVPHRLPSVPTPQE